MRGAFASPEKAKQISKDMQKKMEKINQNLRAALVRNGFSENYLQPVYRCPVCKDTGYVGEPIHEPCACLKRTVLNKLYQNEGLQGLEHENFDTFDESIFPDTPIEGKSRASAGIFENFGNSAKTTPISLSRKRERDCFFPEGRAWAKRF